MRPKKYKINDPVLNEFIYSILYNASLEAKRIIPPRLLKYVNNEKEAKKFIRRSSLDEQITLLSYLGVGHGLIFFDEKSGSIKELRAILEKYKDNRTIASLKDIVQGKFFVSTDKEFNTLLGLMAQTIHHKSYSMNLEFTRVGHHIKNWSRRLDPGEDAPTLEVLEKSNLLASTLLSSSVTLSKVDFLFRLRPIDIQVLLYLYPLKHTYVLINQLYLFFDGLLPKMTVGAAVKNLINSHHLQVSAISKNREVTISALGVKIVNDYMSAVLHANHFQ